MSEFEVKPNFSVMIPAWNPNPEYLKEALFSVLNQKTEGISLQIAIVDDASDRVDIKGLLVEWEIADKVDYHRNESQHGIGGNWNRCIELAKGEWIHIFHQDDVLLDGFYAKMNSVQRSIPTVKAIFSRNVYLDEIGNWRTLSRRESQIDGFLPDFLYSVHESDVQCPSVIVRSEVYKEIGVFNVDLSYSLDKEMWARIASKYSWYYLVNPLSCFRVHEKSQSHKVLVSNKMIDDVLKGAQIVWSYMTDPQKRQFDEKKLRTNLALAQLRKNELSLVVRAKSAYAIAPYLSTFKHIMRAI